MKRIAHLIASREIMSVHNKDHLALVVNRRFLVFSRRFSAEIDEFRLGWLSDNVKMVLLDLLQPYGAVIADHKGATV